MHAVSTHSRHLNNHYNDQHSSSSSPTGAPSLAHKTGGNDLSRSVSNGMRQRTNNKRERPRPMGSLLLSEAENHQLFETLGPERISLAAGVAQLLGSSPIEAPNAGGGQWRKWHLGVASLVKDYSKKCYSIGLFDVCNGEPLWSQTLYKDFRATTYPSCPRFISFEGDHCVFALSFSDPTEAHNFKDHLQKRSEHEQKSHQREHRMTTPSQHHQTATPSRPPCPQPANSHPAGTPSSRYQQPTSPPHHGGITAVGTVPHYNTSMHQMSLCTNTSAASNKAQPTKQHSKLKDSKKAKKGDKRPKHRKEDISNPTDFKHLAHVGWDQDGGISRQVYSHEPLDDSVRDLLRAAGQNPDHFDNPEDIKFVYEFLEERGIDRQNLQQNNAATTFPLNNYSHNQPPSNNYAQRSVSMEQHQQHGGPPLVPPVVVRRDVSAPIHHAAKQAPPPRPPPVLNGSHGRPLPQPPPQISGHHKGGQAGFHQAQHPTNGGGRQLPMLPGDGVPTRVDAGGSSHRPPPPPAPPVSNVAPLASNVPPPPPPPPPSLLQGPSPANGSSVPKPPPPPPLKVAQMSGGGDGRSNLLAQIQAGPKLKHVDGPAPDKQPIATNPPNSRDNMMMQIKQGTQLKHVDAHDSENRKSVTTVQDLGGIAGALARALEERRKNMMNSEDSDESAADQNESEWED